MIRDDLAIASVDDHVFDAPNDVDQHVPVRDWSLLWRTKPAS
jgi:hypothetical protein